jgi:hypothetical protein
MKKTLLFVLLAGIAAFTLPSDNFAKDFPASYVPHITINKYLPQRDGTVIVDLSWDNIPQNIDANGIITVAGPNIANVEGGNDGVNRVTNTVDNIHFTIKKEDGTVMKLIYGQRDKDKGYGYNVVEYWLFKIAGPDGK